MAMEMGLWRADGDTLQRIQTTGVELETHLESYIESDPTMLGRPLLIIGKQVATAHGGFIDLLALDENAAVHVIELKRDKTPRDVTAQAIDYGSWVATLGRSEVQAIFESYRPGTALESAFDERFNAPLPDEVNATQVLTIVAARVDAATERIVRFLNTAFGVPINVVFFRHFQDNDAVYLARSWLVEAESESATSTTTAGRKARTREPWNGTDWYVSFGESGQGRNWDDALKYGFVSAGGGEWFSRTLKNVPVGARVFVCIPKRGYVGVGTVTAEAQRFDEVTVNVGGATKKLSDAPLQGNYHVGASESDDSAEWAATVDWVHAVPREDAVWHAGMFANQNSATRLRQQFTIERVSAAFGLGE